MKNILGKAENMEFWTKEVREKEVFAEYRRQCLDYWEKNGLETKEFTVLKYSDYKLFWTTGDRGIFEREYFSRRTALEYTVPLALMYPEENKYIEKIMDWVYMICDEYSWCLPAHQGALEPNNNSRIDLFASECGFWLAMIDRLLGDRLEPLIRNRIKYELERRIVTPFLAVDNYGWWEVGHMNWTAVCICGVAGVIMLSFPELMDEKLIARLNKSMDGFLEGFKDDGICLEGCGYWAYGVGFFLQYADMIRRFTDGEVDYFKIPKVKTIATFPQKMFLSDDACVSFADGGRTLNYPIGVLHRFKDEYPEDVLVYSSKYATYGIGCGRMGYRIFAAAWLREEYYNNPADNTTAFESYAADSEWLVKRTSSYGFAAKAGNNNEFHNHNDVGSFIFAKGGRQLVMDLGSGKYTRQYFEHETRYTILECAAFGHNLPLFDGQTQKYGAQFRATDVSYAPGRFSMDIAGAYGNPAVKSARRCFECLDGSVVLTDEFDYDGEIVERILTTITPTEQSAGCILIGEATLSYDPTTCSATVNTAEGTANKEVYLIDFKLNAGVKSFTLKMQ